MRQYVLGRLVQLVVVMIGISIVTFCLTYVLGDPSAVLLPMDAPPETRALFRKELGLDQPLIVQYARFASGAIRGDFGESFLMKKSALALVMERLPATYQLALAGLLFGLAIAVPLGTLAAYRRGSWIDNLCTMLAVAGQAIPIYWLGLMLMIVFAVQLRWLPASGYGEPANFVLPTIALGSFLAPITMRLVRSNMIDVLSQDYIRTARAKGLAGAVVLARHAFKNAALPVIAVLGLQFGQLLGGAVVTETVFSWPGVASFTVSSIANGDYPVVQAAVVILAASICIVNLSVDVLIGYLDPRIRQ
ncbi:MAG TPA: ABC transporter permease [Chloroflexota bacterium]|nr:ABC transporter permease [Chloroflexota bacterium]